MNACVYICRISHNHAITASRTCYYHLLYWRLVIDLIVTANSSRQFQSDHWLKTPGLLFKTSSFFIMCFSIFTSLRNLPYPKRWKCIYNISFLRRRVTQIRLSNITNTRDRVTPHCQTPRREFKLTMVCGVFWTSFEVFGNIVKHFLKCFVYPLNRNWIPTFLHIHNYTQCFLRAQHSKRISSQISNCSKLFFPAQDVFALFLSILKITSIIIHSKYFAVSDWLKPHA